MESAFIYNQPVCAKDFFGRKEEVALLKSILSSCSPAKNAVLYEPAKTGKSSLIAETLRQMKKDGDEFRLIESTLLSVRTPEELALRIAGDTMQSVAGSSPELCRDFVREHLDGTALALDTQSSIPCLKISGSLTQKDLRAALSIPGKLPGNTIFKIAEFQNVLLLERQDEVLDSFVEPSGKTHWIFSGSRVNAMRSIFEPSGFFRSNCERVKISPLSLKQIEEMVHHGFDPAGKVIERELICKAAQILRSNVWYLQHLFTICDSSSRGFITLKTFNQCFEALLSIHEPGFISTVNELTCFQISLLKAIIEGQYRFSSASVLNKYALHSSANVKRLKEALGKKEIALFPAKGKPVILDPLFEYWLKTRYFRMKDSQE